MYRRLGALMGMIGFILVAGSWILRTLFALSEGEPDPSLPTVETVLVRALVAMLVCFVIGGAVSRLGIGLLDEARKQAMAARMAGVPDPDTLVDTQDEKPDETANEVKPKETGEDTVVEGAINVAGQE